MNDPISQYNAIQGLIEHGKAVEQWRNRVQRTCEWETAAPPKTCGRTAMFFGSGKYLCQEHSDALNKRFPIKATLLEKK